MIRIYKCDTQITFKNKVGQLDLVKIKIFLKKIMNGIVKGMGSKLHTWRKHLHSTYLKN